MKESQENHVGTLKGKKSQLGPAGWKYRKGREVTIQGGWLQREKAETESAPGGKQRVESLEYTTWIYWT